MKIKEILEHFAVTLGYVRPREPLEIFIPIDLYKQLCFEYSQIQRMPIDNKGMDFGVEIMGVLKVKPIVELTSLKEEAQRLEKLSMKLMSEIQARALVFEKLSGEKSD